MAKPIVSAARLRELLHYDPETGVFTWRVNRGRTAKAGSIAGFICKPQGYINTSVDGRTYKTHRLAWLHVYGEWPLQDIDHLNGVRTDNRIANLRDVSRSFNMQNRRTHSTHNKAGVLGVSFHKKTKKWMAQITNNGRRITLGYYETTDLAYAFYISAKRVLHPGNTL